METENDVHTFKFTAVEIDFILSHLNYLKNLCIEVIPVPDTLSFRHIIKTMHSVWNQFPEDFITQEDKISRKRFNEQFDKDFPDKKSKMN